jgi:hypothetical protein
MTGPLGTPDFLAEAQGVLASLLGPPTSSPKFHLFGHLLPRGQTGASKAFIGHFVLINLARAYFSTHDVNQNLALYSEMT